jgi:HlyD family secretion protein
LVVLIFLLLAVGAGAWRYEQTAVQAPAELILQGNIDVRQVNLSFKVSGRIQTLYVDEGDSVKAGQLIGILDERYFQDDLRIANAQRDQAAANLERLRNGSRPEEITQARAQEAEAQATLKRAKADFQRYSDLRGTGGISEQQIDSAQAAFRESEAHVKSLGASLRLAELGPRQEDVAAGQAQYDASVAQVTVAQRKLDDAHLIAPSDGAILTRAREQGAIVNSGETVFTLTLSSPVWGRTYVGEPDLGAVQPGLAVVVKTDTVNGNIYTGHIGFVSPTAEFTPKYVETRELRTDLVYRLRVVVDDPDGGLRQGMPVTVTVNTAGMRQRTFKERLIQTLFLDKLGFDTTRGR